MKYFIMHNYGRRKDIEMFFTSHRFDESWKTGDEGDVGGVLGDLGIQDET